jgi:hypothetical protein
MMFMFLGCVSPVQEADCVTELQEALDEARDGDVIEVCPGTYTERLVIEGKSLGLRSREGAEHTVVDAQGEGVVLSITEGAQVTVEGLTLRGGGNPGNGGNLYCSSSTLWLEESRLEDGWAVTGGALGVTSCEGHVVGNTFEGNEAWSGGAAWIYGDGLVFAENAFVSNHADSAGGAIYLYGSSTMAGNLFLGNDATYAGALYVDQGEAELVENLFVSNEASLQGGALYGAHSELDLANSLLRDNGADEGGAVYLQGGRGALHQLVMLENEARVGSALASLEGEVALFNSVLGWNYGGTLLSGAASVHHNDLFRNEEQPALAGNLSVAPEFSSLSDGDYTLQTTSPLRDAGDPDVLDGDGSRSDIGMYGG